MGKRSLLAAFLLVTSIFAILIGSSFVTAVINTGDVGGSTIASGCKKSFCTDSVIDADIGEECISSYTPAYYSDVCPNGAVRTKTCVSCVWDYTPASCPVCGNAVAEQGEACDWGTKNGVWSATVKSCSTGILNTHYTCAQDCSGFVYESQCGVCGDNIWNSQSEDCDWGPNGLEGAGATTICPDGTVQRTDCSGDCIWVKVPDKCPPAPCEDGQARDPVTGECPPQKVCKITEFLDPSTGNCIPIETCGSQTTACDKASNSVVTKQSCNKAGVTTDKIISSVACGANELCAKSPEGTAQCLPDCSKAVTCSPWSAPQPGNVCKRTCTSSDPASCPVNEPTVTTEANGKPCPYHCENGVQDADETGVDCGVAGGDCKVCPTTTVTQICTPGSVSLGSHQCSGCGTAVEVVCDATGTKVLTRTVTDASCTSGCEVAPPPPPEVDPCEGKDPDNSQQCCTSKGFKWAKSGETRPFGGFTSKGQYGCVGDDAGEYLRYRECEGGVCTTDSTDSAACASINSCVLNSQCFTRLDKSVAEEPDIAQLVQNCQGKSDDVCKLVNEVDDAEKRAKNTKDRNEKRKISKDEIAPKILKLKKLGVIKSEGQEGAQAVGTTGNLLCIPKP